MLLARGDELFSSIFFPKRFQNCLPDQVINMFVNDVNMNYLIRHSFSVRSSHSDQHLGGGGSRSKSLIFLHLVSKLAN